MDREHGGIGRVPGDDLSPHDAMPLQGSFPRRRKWAPGGGGVHSPTGGWRVFQGREASPAWQPGLLI